MEQRDLHRVRQLGGEAAVVRVLVEDQRRRARDETERTRQVRPLDRLGQKREWMEGEERADPGERRVAEQAIARKRREGLGAGEGAYARPRRIAAGGGPREKNGGR